MITNPKKLMAIYNSNAATVANSLAAAQYYAMARNLDPAHIQGYDLGEAANISGATNRDAFRAGALTQIRDYIINNSIEAVLLSIGCPAHMDTVDGTGTSSKSLCRVIGDAPRVLAGVATTGPACGKPNRQATVYGRGGSAAIHKSWTQVRMRIGNTDTSGYGYDYRTVPDSTSFGASKQTPCGRLGYHNGDPTTDSLALAQRCVDDAIWFEQNGNPADEPFLFGFADRSALLEQGNIWDAWQQLHEHVGIAHVYDGDYLNAANTKHAAQNWSWELPEVTILNQAAWLMGGGPNIELWGWLGAGFNNNDNAYLPSVSFKRGGWMFESTSSFVSKYAIPAGACAAIGPIGEPYPPGLPEIGGLVYFLLRNFSLEEATVATMSYNGNADQCEVCGDPYYSPLNKIRYSKTGGMSAGGDGA